LPFFSPCSSGPWGVVFELVFSHGGNCLLSFFVVNPGRHIGVFFFLFPFFFSSFLSKRSSGRFSSFFSVTPVSLPSSSRREADVFLLCTVVSFVPPFLFSSHGGPSMSEVLLFLRVCLFGSSPRYIDLFPFWSRYREEARRFPLFSSKSGKLPPIVPLFFSAKNRTFFREVEWLSCLSPP